MSTAGAASWDKECAGGRYRHEPPVAFVADILAAARRAGQWTQWEGIWRASE
jgi:hypothetical protein